MKLLTCILSMLFFSFSNYGQGGGAIAVQNAVSDNIPPERSDLLVDLDEPTTSLEIGVGDDVYRACGDRCASFDPYDPYYSYGPVSITGQIADSIYDAMGVFSSRIFD